MAKMFYTLDETKSALGKSEDDIKQYTREGRLREFRDGPRLMFKADQVEALKAQLGGGSDPVDLGPSDSGAPIGLADSAGASGAGIGLSEGAAMGSGLSGISSGSGLAGISGSGLGSGLTGGAGSGMMNLKEDTALAADLGLSGTVGGMPSPSRSGTSSGTSAGSRSGINVFGDDTAERVDPMAQTAMPSSPGASAVDLNLEGIGSGSGLLDLTRESDDTSLGAELLDEISPGAKRPQAPPDSGVMSGVSGLEAPRGGVVRGTVGVQVLERPDPSAGFFGGAALGAGLVLLFAVFALVAALFGVHPQAVDWFQQKNLNIWTIMAIGLVGPALFGIFGWLMGKGATAR
jgi:hypothetical protein